jgi:hypothetical protein
MKRRRFMLLLTVAGLAAWLAAAAWAEEATGSVQGTVALAGYPLPTAKVVLHPGGGKALESRVDEGTFAFEKVPAGTYRVAVTGASLPESDVDPAMSGWNAGRKDPAVDEQFARLREVRRRAPSGRVRQHVSRIPPADGIGAAMQL